MFKKLFSTPGCLVILLVICVAITLYHHMTFIDGTMFIMPAFFCFKGLAIAASSIEGYGTKKPRLEVLGIPVVLAAFFSIVLAISMMLIFMSYQLTDLSSITILRIKVFSWSPMNGFIIALCHWYFYARLEYYYRSEYEIRLECHARGDSAELTELLLTRLREQGTLRPQ